MPPTTTAHGDILPRCRLALGAFIVGLILSGVTALPLLHELELLARSVSAGADLRPDPRHSAAQDWRMDCSRTQTRNPDKWLEAAPDFSRPIVADLRDWIFRTATYQREYVGWLTTAKREGTRAPRLAQTLKALTAGRKWIDRKQA